MDLEKYSRSLANGEKAEALKKLADSETGKQVGAMLREQELMRAVKSNDAAALSAMLSDILSTPQGKALAEEVKKAVKS